MNRIKIIVALSAACFVCSLGVEAAATRNKTFDNLTVKRKAKVGAGLVVNGGVDINGTVNIPQGPLNVMGNKLKVDNSGVNVSGQLKVNGQTVGGSSSSVNAPFEVRTGSTPLFTVDTKSNVNVGRMSGSTAGTVNLGNSASGVNVGVNCPNVQIGKNGGQVNINGTVKVNGQAIGTGGGTSGTVKGTFEVKNTGGSTTYFRVDGSNGSATFSRDAIFNDEAIFNKKATFNDDVQLKGQLLDEAGDPIDLGGGGGTSGEVIGEFAVKDNPEAPAVFFVNPGEQAVGVIGDFRVKTPGGDSLIEATPTREGENWGQVIVRGDLQVTGNLTDGEGNPIGGGEGGGSSNEVIGSFVVKPGPDSPPMFEVNPEMGNIVINGSLVDGDGNPLIDEGGMGNDMQGHVFDQLDGIALGAEPTPLVNLTFDGTPSPVLVQLWYVADGSHAAASGVFILKLDVLLGASEPIIIDGAASFDGTPITDLAALVNLSFDGGSGDFNVALNDYSTTNGTLFYHAYGKTLTSGGGESPTP